MILYSRDFGIGLKERSLAMFGPLKVVVRNPNNFTQAIGMLLFEGGSLLQEEREFLRGC
jgi:hypothetical protein